MNTKVFFFLFFLFFTSNISANQNNIFIIDRNIEELTTDIDFFFKSKNIKIKKVKNKMFEIYFDVPELLYLNKNGFIRYEAVQYLTKKKQKIRYKEKLFYSLDGDKITSYSVKHYKNVKSLEEKHPLLSLVKRKERKSFLSNLNNDGIRYPMRLKEVVEVSKISDVITAEDERFQSIKVSLVEASSLEHKTSFLMLNLNSTDEKFRKDFLNQLDIREENFSINEYTLIFNKMKENVYLFNLILEYPYLVNLLYSIIMALGGLLIILILFRKRFIYRCYD